MILDTRTGEERERNRREELERVALEEGWYQSSCGGAAWPDVALAFRELRKEVSIISDMLDRLCEHMGTRGDGR